MPGNTAFWRLQAIQMRHIKVPGYQTLIKHYDNIKDNLKRALATRATLNMVVVSGVNRDGLAKKSAE